MRLSTALAGLGLVIVLQESTGFVMRMSSTAGRFDRDSEEGSLEGAQPVDNFGNPREFMRRAPTRQAAAK